jgi:hypothetical protein
MHFPYEPPPLNYLFLSFQTCTLQVLYPPDKNLHFYLLIPHIDIIIKLPYLYSLPFTNDDDMF